VVWGDPKGTGVYTCEQWKPYGTQIFEEARRNHDGYVDAQEFEAIRKSHPMFKGADLGYFDDNRDGQMSLSEFVDKPNPFFVHHRDIGADHGVALRRILRAYSGLMPVRDGGGFYDWAAKATAPTGAGRGLRQWQVATL
jgi:hypothetical protein